MGCVLGFSLLCYLCKFATNKFGSNFNAWPTPVQYTFSIRWSSTPWRDKVVLGFESVELAREWRELIVGALQNLGMQRIYQKRGVIKARSTSNREEEYDTNRRSLSVSDSVAFLN